MPRRIENAGELHTSRGVPNKGHPIRTRIFRSKSSLGHSLTLVDNLTDLYTENTIVLKNRSIVAKHDIKDMQTNILILIFIQ